MERTSLRVHPVGTAYETAVWVDAIITPPPLTRRTEYTGATGYMVKWNNRWRRVHHMYFTAYFMDRGTFMVVI